MPELSPAAVILLALGLVVLINGVMLLSFSRSRLSEQIRLLRRATQQARDPWKSEDQALEELGRRVSELPHPQAESSDDLLDP